MEQKAELSTVNSQILKLQQCSWVASENFISNISAKKKNAILDSLSIYPNSNAMPHYLITVKYLLVCVEFGKILIRQGY